MAAKIILALCVLLLAGCMQGSYETLEPIATDTPNPTVTHSIPQPTETVTPYAPTPTRFPSNLPRADCTARVTSARVEIRATEPERCQENDEGDIECWNYGRVIGEIARDGLVPIYLPTLEVDVRGVGGEWCVIHPERVLYLDCNDIEFEVLADSELVC